MVINESPLSSKRKQAVSWKASADACTVEAFQRYAKHACFPHIYEMITCSITDVNTKEEEFILSWVPNNSSKKTISLLYYTTEYESIKT